MLNPRLTTKQTRHPAATNSAGPRMVAQLACHQLAGLKPVVEGWGYEPAHHRALWQQTLPAVERRPLEVYEEVARCS